MANSPVKASQPAGSSLMPAELSAENSAAMRADFMSKKAGENDDYHYKNGSPDDEDPGPLQWPVIVRPEEAINVKKACEMAGQTDRTIRSWCKKYRIGSAMAGGRLRISAPGLMMVVHGDIQALELLRNGDRYHPRVARYLDEVGVP